MDRESVYALSIGLSRGTQADEPDSRVNIEQRLVEFILEFQIDNAFIYRLAITGIVRRANADKKQRSNSRKCAG